MLQVFYIGVAKIDRGCCTCCNGYTRMFQVYVPNVSSVSDVYCKCFYLDVAKVYLDVAYTCMLQEYVPNVSSVFFDVCCKCVYLDVAYVSHICCKCFI